MTFRRETSILSIFHLAVVFPSAWSNSTTTPIPSPDVCVGGDWSCKGRCDELQSLLPCSCNIRCLVYNTCCEDYREACDYVAHPDFENISKFFNSTLIQSMDNAFIIKCLNRTNPEDVYLCENGFGMGPVSDLSLGLHFYSEFCSRCNDLPDFIPWDRKAVCERSTFASGGKIKMSTLELCETYLEPPLPIRNAFSQVYSPQLGPLTTKSGCSDEQFDLCRSFFSFVSVTTTARVHHLLQNRYCLICMNLDVLSCSVPQLRVYRVHHQTQFVSLIKWRRSDYGRMFIFTSIDGSTDTFDTECTYDPKAIVTYRNKGTCRILSCPKQSIPVFNSSYCLQIPVPVEVILEVDALTNVSEQDLTNSQPLERFSSDCRYNGTFELTMTSISFRLLCNWSTTSATTQQLKTLYSIVSTSLEPYIRKSKINKMKTASLSIFGFPISETASVYTHNRILSLVPFAFVWTVAIIGSALSLGCLCCRISIQPLSHLLNSQPGRMQCCLCVSLAFAYASFLLTQSLEQNSLPCWVVSILMHLFYLCSLFWMNAITVDLWKRFRSGRILSSISESRSMKMVVLYTCVLPLIVVGISTTMDLVLPDSKISPAYGQNLCWINNSFSMIIFFAVPVSVLSLANIVLILLTCISLHSPYKRSDCIEDISPVLGAGVVVSMASLTGIIWLLGVVAGLVDHRVLWVIFSAVNSSYGLIVGLILMCNRRIWLSVKIPCKKRNPLTNPGAVNVSSGVNAGQIEHISFRVRNEPDGQLSSAFKFEQDGQISSAIRNCQDGQSLFTVSNKQNGKMLSAFSFEHGGNISSAVSNGQDGQIVSAVNNGQEGQILSTVSFQEVGHISSAVSNDPDGLIPPGQSTSHWSLVKAGKISSCVSNGKNKKTSSCVSTAADADILSCVSNGSDGKISYGVSNGLDGEISSVGDTAADGNIRPDESNGQDEHVPSDGESEPNVYDSCDVDTGSDGHISTGQSNGPGHMSSTVMNGRNEEFSSDAIDRQN